MKSKSKPEFPLVIETFYKLWSYQTHDWRREQEPSCFNGIVSVRRYRITVEEIDEPKEVIAARIVKLWRECDNMHHIQPIKIAAKRYGVELNHDDYAKDRNRRT
jgi:hypothetical protein